MDEKSRFIERRRVDENFIPKTPPLIISIFYTLVMVVIFFSMPPICEQTPNNNWKAVLMAFATIFFISWIVEDNELVSLKVGTSFEE